MYLAKVLCVIRRRGRHEGGGHRSVCLRSGYKAKEDTLILSIADSPSTV